MIGRETALLDDATATFDRAGPDGRMYGAAEIHAISLASLHGEFATVLQTEQVLAALSDSTPG